MRPSLLEFTPYLFNKIGNYSAKERASKDKESKSPDFSDLAEKPVNNAQLQWVPETKIPKKFEKKFDKFVQKIGLTPCAGTPKG